ncbi:MAG: Lrp/AsnC family transcriptional regulator [Pseudomonadota bacterium]
MDEKLDNLDIKILSALQKDASQSIEALADQVALSRNACWRRIKKLEADGIIKARVALVDPAKVGLDLSVYVLVRTNRHDPQWLKDFRSAISQMPEIIGAHRMTGDLDYVLRVRVADMAAYDHFYQRLIDKVPIADVSASFVMEDIKDSSALPL